MSIRIEIICDSAEELTNTLIRLANDFSAALSGIALDTAQHTGQRETASPAEAEDDTTHPNPPARRGRGRPPKAKTDTVATPPGEAVADKAPAGEASEPDTTSIDEQDIADVISALTDKFKNGTADVRAIIRDWRDSIGLVKMGDLKGEQVEAARNFLKALEG